MEQNADHRRCKTHLDMTVFATTMKTFTDIERDVSVENLLGSPGQNV